MSSSAAQQNYLQIREQQQLNRERMREAAKDKEQTKELLRRQRAQYDHVPSHGYGRPVSSTDDIEIKVFLRECDGERARSFSFMESEAAQRQNSGEQAARPVAARLPPVPAHQKRKQQSSTSALSVPRGAVPQYILRRKAELDAEKEAIQHELERQREVAKYPPGHRPITETERKETLKKLATRRKELEGELHKIPIRYDTQAIKIRRSKIENELSEIDEAEQKFSSTKTLFVPV